MEQTTVRIIIWAVDNGTSIASGIYKIGYYSCTSNSEKGSLTTGHYSLTGYIDDFRIYNIVLTPPQVTEIFNNTLDPA